MDARRRMLCEVKSRWEMRRVDGPTTAVPHQ